MLNFLTVAAGGAIGSAARYLVAVGAARLFGTGFPYGTLAVNVAGSFVMGVLLALFARSGASPAVRLFLTTGILGGFTTFSAFSADTVGLAERGALGMAALYLGASIVGPLLALVGGLWIVRSFA